MTYRHAILIGLVALSLGGIAAARATRFMRPDAPDATIIQSAYDAAKASAVPGRHFDDLVVESAECNPLATKEYMCQVSFTRRAEASGRLYFDVVTMTAADEGWQLTAGLCRAQTRI